MQALETHSSPAIARNDPAPETAFLPRLRAVRAHPVTAPPRASRPVRLYRLTGHAPAQRSVRARPALLTEDGALPPNLADGGTELASNARHVAQRQPRPRGVPACSVHS